MRWRRPAALGPVLALALAVAVAGCGDSGTAAAPTAKPTAQVPRPLPAVRARPAAGPPTRRSRPADEVALVTAEAENRLVVVNARTGRVRERLRLADDPENVTVARAAIVVVSARAGAVTVLNPSSLRPLEVIRGFASPHIPAITPDGDYAAVTDDARGTLTMIRLPDGRITATVAVGAGAHHLSFSPDGRRLWVALGESAHTIVVLDAGDPARPREIGSFDPGFLAHDLHFSPDGASVWVTAADGPDTFVLDAATHRLRFRVPVGTPPQHLAFYRADAYLTSGYAGVLERVRVATGTLLGRVRAPYGSFELDAGGGSIAVSSLLRGSLALYTPGLMLRRVLTIGAAARDVALARAPVG